MIDTDVLILGAGLTGLAAATSLGERALVLEREARPGGLVRTECHDGYWFDHVIHLLYFADLETRARIRGLLGPLLAPCPPVAWVECRDGIVRFPFQNHLGGLSPEVGARCFEDFRAACVSPPAQPARHFEEMLLNTFGRAMCETFFFPYNQKLWKRPLNSLAPSGFQWTITRPPLEQVLEGLVNPQTAARSYNADGWYPRPPADFPVRGMEVLSNALAEEVADLRLQCTVEAIDLDARTVLARRRGRREVYRYRQACLSTLPLPRMLALCRQTPRALRQSVRELTCNRVLSIALSIEGPRPEGRGHWRYYVDPEVCFNRLVYLHEFDPQCAPAHGWALLAELTEPAELPAAPEETVLDQVCADIVRVGALPPGCRIVARRLLNNDPGYVVFTPENQAVVTRARDFLTDAGVTPLGRYGRWEYSSMAQVMRDGFAWAARVGERELRPAEVRIEHRAAALAHASGQEARG